MEEAEVHGVIHFINAAIYYFNIDLRALKQTYRTYKTVLAMQRHARAVRGCCYCSYFNIMESWEV